MLKRRIGVFAILEYLLGGLRNELVVGLRDGTGDAGFIATQMSATRRRTRI